MRFNFKITPQTNAEEKLTLIEKLLKKIQGNEEVLGEPDTLININEKIDPLNEMLDKLNLNMDKLNPLTEITELLKPISEVCALLLNPKETLKNIWIDLMDISFWAVAIAGTICIILYVCGHKKAIRYTLSGTVIYAILNIIDEVVMSWKV